MQSSSFAVSHMRMAADATDTSERNKPEDSNYRSAGTLRHAFVRPGQRVHRQSRHPGLPTELGYDVIEFTKAIQFPGSAATG
ncbi:hypothetical protein GCM10010518_52930 [Kitasatospora cinereorecta]